MSTNRFDGLHAWNAVRGASGAVAGVLALGAGLSAPMNAQAALVITDINFTVTFGNQLTIDLNGDGKIDFIVAVPSVLKGKPEFGALVGYGIDNNFNPRVSTLGNGFLTRYVEGGSVGDATLGEIAGSGIAYETDFSSINGGEWNAVGVHGFAGVVMFNDSQESTNYGWIELTRGSLTVGRIGYETESGVAANIPGRLPEPATLALLASSAVGIAAMRRRQRQASAKA
jgi:hypothetical protein